MCYYDARYYTIAVVLYKNRRSIIAYAIAAQFITSSIENYYTLYFIHDLMSCEVKMRSS